MSARYQEASNIFDILNDEYSQEDWENTDEMIDNDWWPSSVACVCKTMFGKDE